MEDSGIDSDPKTTSHVEDERLFLVSILLLRWKDTDK